MSSGQGGDEKQEGKVVERISHSPAPRQTFRLHVLPTLIYPRCRCFISSVDSSSNSFRLECAQKVQTAQTFTLNLTPETRNPRPYYRVGGHEKARLEKGAEP